MALIFHEKTAATDSPRRELGLWRIEESEEVLRKSLHLHTEEIKQLDGIKGEGRRREFLAARNLLHQMSGRKDRGALIKDEFGKPHLENSPLHISISHTEDLSAAVAHPFNCGIDVQVFVNKIARLAPRFMNEAELNHLTDANRLIFQHLIWGAKEAMYKAYGRREIDFREHLFVELTGIPLESGTTKGYLVKDELKKVYELDYRIFDGNYMLVVAVEDGNA
jgi:phosphopantetheinyl transferase